MYTLIALTLMYGVVSSIYSCFERDYPTIF